MKNPATSKGFNFLLLFTTRNLIWVVSPRNGSPKWILNWKMIFLAHRESSLTGAIKEWFSIKAMAFMKTLCINQSIFRVSLWMSKGTTIPGNGEWIFFQLISPPRFLDLHFLPFNYLQITKIQLKSTRETTWVWMSTTTTTSRWWVTPTRGITTPMTCHGLEK